VSEETREEIQARQHEENREMAEAFNKLIKPRTLEITMTTKEEAELCNYLDRSIYVFDEFEQVKPPRIVVDILEALRQAESGKTIEYEGGPCCEES
jgi:hypothetical protein